DCATAGRTPRSPGLPRCGPVGARTPSRGPHTGRGRELDLAPLRKTGTPVGTPVADALQPAEERRKRPIGDGCSRDVQQVVGDDRGQLAAELTAGRVLREHPDPVPPDVEVLRPRAVAERRGVPVYADRPGSEEARPA